MKTGQLFLILLMLFCADLITAREVIPVQQPTSLSFIANAGQITDQYNNLRKDIDYKLNAPGMDIFIGHGQIHYQWTKYLKPAAREVITVEKGSNDSQIEIYRMDVELVGANKKAKVIAEEPQGYYERYYTAHTGVEGVTAHSYQKITYQNVYPNIDWVLYVRDNQLKYDFVVHPGGDPKDIKLKYEGVDELNIKDGALTATNPFGSITEQRPYSYEATGKKEINTIYKLSGSIVSFSTAPFSGTFVIDPLLVWATYYGGSGDDGGIGAVATDIYGNVYMGGETSSASNIATAGAHQTAYLNGVPAFLAKFNSSGQRIWGTYYGYASNNRQSTILDICYSPIGALYVGGVTNHTGTNVIATAGSHQSVYGGGTYDGFIARFDTAGQRIWGTYYGGNDQDRLVALSTDVAGNVYAAGWTSSTSDIATPGSFKTVFNGLYSGFLSKFNSAGQQIWGTYFSGSGSGSVTYANGVCLDAAGNIYLGGSTNDPAGLSTSGSYQPQYAGGIFDGYLAKFNNNGQQLWCTYAGGEGSDMTPLYYKDLAIDYADNIYLTGGTTSFTGIATPGATQPALSGTQDCYVFKFNSQGQKLWGTYLGGTGADYPTRATFDNVKNIYVSGGTNSLAGLATTAAYQSIYGGGLEDGFIMKLDYNGQKLWGTYYGGGGGDYLVGVCTDTSGNIYLAGGGGSTSNITTAGSHQPVFGGGALDAYLIKFHNEDTLVYIKSGFTDTLLCAGDTLHVVYGVTNPFRSNNFFTLQLSDASGSFAAPTVLTTVAVNTGGMIVSKIPFSVLPGTGYRVRIIASGPADTSLYVNLHIKGPLPPAASANTPVCAGATLNLNALSGGSGVSYSWMGPGSFTSNQQNPAIPAVTVSASGDYIVTALLNGCSLKDTVTVTVNSVLNATIGGTGACLGGTLNLTASTTSPGATYSWNGPNSFTSNLQNPTISGVTAAAAGTYTVVITGSGCSTTLTTNVTIGNPPNAPSAGSNTPVCSGQNINLSSLSTTPGVSYSWTGPGSYTSTQQSPTRTNATVAMSGTYNVVAILNGCNSTATATNVVVNPAPAAPTASNNGPLCAGVALDLFATGVPGATYSWNGPGSYTSNAQNPTILNASTANAGTYTVTQTVAGCTSPAASTTVVINNSVNPAINIFPNPNDSVCPGTVVTFVSVATNGGTTPQYQWYKNGNPIGGATNATYNTSSFNSGDYFSCQLTSNAFCAVPATKMSNNVTLTLIPPAPAQVNITANPGLVLSPWQLVTFTATSVMGGIAPSYQWYRNGQKVIGATSTTWSANNLNNLDTISVVLLSSDPCAVPNTDTSNQLVVNIKTGISKMDHDNNITLYPNPNNGDFIVKGNINAKEVGIEILNAIGQTVYSSRLPVSSSQLFEQAIHLDVASGVYLLKVATEAQTETLRFSVQR